MVNRLSKAELAAALKEAFETKNYAVYLKLLEKGTKNVGEGEFS